LDVRSAILRNIRQSQYPNSKLNEPISDFKLFLPDNATTATHNTFFMTDYGAGTKQVLNYNQPKINGEPIRLCSKQPVAAMSPEQMKWYRETKHNNKFPRPLPSLGTNDLEKLRQDKATTFKYNHYAPVTNPYYVDNPIYYTDLSQDNIEMHNKYTEDREEFSQNMINGIIDDMNILANPGSAGKVNTNGSSSDNGIANEIINNLSIAQYLRYLQRK
jgi:hypothetical protein